jgi:hypothetical protein
MKTRSAVFARRIWAEVLLTIAPALRRFRRLMSLMGIIPVNRGQQIAKVIPIAPYLKSRPSSARAPERTPVRIINMHAPRTSKRGF